MDKLTNRRKYYGLSQRQVADRAWISPSEYNYVERGLKLPNVLIAIRIARVLKTTVEDLWGEER